MHYIDEKFSLFNTLIRLFLLIITIIILKKKYIGKGLHLFS